MKSKRSNPQSITFLAEMFGMIFYFTRSFLTKLNISSSSKVFSETWEIFSCPKNFFLFVEKFLKWPLFCGRPGEEFFRHPHFRRQEYFFVCCFGIVGDVVLCLLPCDKTFFA